MKCEFLAARPPGIVALVLPQNEVAHAVDDCESRVPTSAEIVEINRRHLIDTPLKPADLLFVFGTRQDVALRVEEAVRLWREGFFRWGS